MFKKHIVVMSLKYRRRIRTDNVQSKRLLLLILSR